MRKITWILPTVCIVLAVILSFGCILLFTPALVNGYSVKITEQNQSGEIIQTAVWQQDERAHNLLLWMAKHGSKDYRYACAQYLLIAYYNPLSDWSQKHPELGNEVYELAIPLYEQETGATLGGRIYSSDLNLEPGGFFSYTSTGIDYGDIHLQYAVYQYLHFDKETAKQTYLAFADSTDDHYFCDRFLKFVTTAEKSTPEDIAWAKAEALRAESLLLAEYETEIALEKERIAREKEMQAMYAEQWDAYDYPTYDDSSAWRTFTTYSEQQIEMKCQTLRAIAEET